MDQDRIRKHQASNKAKILDAYKQPIEGKEALLITKAQLDEQFPESSHMRFSLQSLTKFRQDLQKAEGVTDPDKAFVDATKDLKAFVITEGDKKAPVFVREKISGE